MKINEYYRGSANVTLNGSIAALVPAMIIGVGNLYFFQNKQIMLLTIPFIVYSFISFQLYLFRMKQSINVGRNILQTKSYDQSIFEASHLVVVFINLQESSVHLFFPDGHRAGMIRRYRQKGFFKKPKIYAFYNSNNEAVGYYKVTQLKTLKIEVFNQNKKYLGCYEKEKGRKELKEASGKFIGAVEGATYYMDEKILDQARQQVGRLRRGWMPVEWSGRFPEPNTPVLSLSESLSDEDKLLRMSFLINEFFIER
jgi:hypothetical protein